MTRDEIIARIREIVRQRAALETELNQLQAQLFGTWLGDCMDKAFEEHATSTQPTRRSA